MYWKSHRESLKNLVVVVKRVAPIPASSAPSERSFSVGTKVRLILASNKIIIRIFSGLQKWQVEPPPQQNWSSNYHPVEQAIVERVLCWIQDCAAQDEGETYCWNWNSPEESDNEEEEDDDGLDIDGVIVSEVIDSIDTDIE